MPTRRCRSIPRRTTRSSSRHIDDSRASTTRTPQPTTRPQARMAAINAAWDLIGTPAKRAAYDREREARARTREASAAPGPGPTAAADTAGGDPRPHRRHRPAPNPRRSRATGRWVDRRWVAGTTPRCGPRTARAPPVSRRATHPGASSRSVDTPVGRSARSAGATSSTSSGWTGRPSDASTATRSTPILRRSGRRTSADDEAVDRRGLFRRR